MEATDRGTTASAIAWATESEWTGTRGPYLLQGEPLPLAPGMTFSNEPGIYIYGEFGVRLEDVMYIDEDGGKLFTEQSSSLARPFG